MQNLLKTIFVSTFFLKVFFMEKENLCTILIELNAVLLNLKKPFRFSSGILSPVFPKTRLLTSFPEKRKRVYYLLKQKIDLLETEFEAVAAIAKGTMFFASILAWEKDLPLLMVRERFDKSDKRTYKLSGFVMPGTKVLVIEDLVTNGASTTAGIEKIREIGAKVVGVVSLMDFEMPTAKTGLKKAGVNLCTLSNYTELIETAHKKNLIDKKEKKLYLEWVKDPENWGEKMGYE